jgi:hypothetical protein
MSSIGTKLDAGQVLKQAYDESNNRLRVDATVSASISDVSIVDANTGDPLTVNPDGSINTNITGNLQIEVSAADGDNIAISDGTNTATVNANGGLNVNVLNDMAIEISASDGDNIAISDGTNTLSVNPDGSLNSKVTATDLDIRNLNSATDSVTVVGALTNTELRASPIPVSGPLTDTQLRANPINIQATNLDTRDLTFATDAVNVSGSTVTLSGAVQLDEPVKVAGTINGSSTGTEYGFVYNQRQQVLDSHDRQDNYTYAGYGTKDQRIIRIDYTSPTFLGIVVRRDFNYVLDGISYRRTNSIWSIV